MKRKTKHIWKRQLRSTLALFFLFLASLVFMQSSAQSQMEALSDTDLEAVTAQSGVSVLISDFQFDWAAGYLTTTLGLEPGTGYGWAPSPGTAGVFIALSDSFGLPVGAPNRDNCLAWLKVLGSQEGQDAFNPLKGSIAARLDSDLTKYNAYGQSAAADWQQDTIAGSLAHGFAANEGFMNDFATVMELFLSTLDPVQAANAAQAIALQNGIGK